MIQNIEVVVLIDSDGRVLGAQLASEVASATTDDAPAASLIPIRGQLALSIDVPGEILNLQGPDLHRFFSEVRVDRDGKVKLPKIRVAKGHGKST